MTNAKIKKQKFEVVEYKKIAPRIKKIHKTDKNMIQHMMEASSVTENIVSLEKRASRIYSEKPQERKEAVKLILASSKDHETQKRLLRILQHGIKINHREAETLLFSLVQKQKSTSFPQSLVLLLCNTLFLVKEPSQTRRIDLLLLLLKKCMLDTSYSSIYSRKKLPVRFKEAAVPFGFLELQDIQPSSHKITTAIRETLVPFLENFIETQKECSASFIKAETCLRLSHSLLNYLSNHND
eukprot:GHVN01062998.1.p1 GENE.GHVN01062998.1~~GHVN01062998.1.p1  ORF type:complete len:240 (+),score=18.27 GHVN01062998.1:3-722(+)